MFKVLKKLWIPLVILVVFGVALSLPLVVWGEAGIGQQHCAIGTDNREGGRLATAHLLSQGRRRIAFLGNPAAPEIGARHAGYLAALADAGVTAEPSLLFAMLGLSLAILSLRMLAVALRFRA